MQINVKTLKLQKKRSGRKKSYHKLENSWSEVCSKLQGKAVQNYEVKIVRLIRDQKSWTIQARVARSLL